MSTDLLWPLVGVVAIAALWDTLRRAFRARTVNVFEQRLEAVEHGLASASERSANALEKAIGADEAARHAVSKVTGTVHPNRWSR
jgi:hypothetical protein